MANVTGTHVAVSGCANSKQLLIAVQNKAVQLRGACVVGVWEKFPFGFKIVFYSPLL